MQLSDKFFTFDTGEKSHFFDIITSSGLSLSLFSIGASIQKIAFKGKKWSDHPETDGNELPITLSSAILIFTASVRVMQEQRLPRMPEGSPAPPSFSEEKRSL